MFKVSRVIDVSKVELGEECDLSCIFTVTLSRDDVHEFVPRLEVVVISTNYNTAP